MSEAAKPVEEEVKKMETSLVFHGRFVDSLLSGTKRHSIRLGTRYYEDSITVQGFRATVNCITHCRLDQVPFNLLQSEGWECVENAIAGLRTIYPNINWTDQVTVVEFKLDIPPSRK